LHVILLTWEFPPRVIGQIGRDAEKTAIELANHNCQVDVVTYHESLIGVEQRSEGFRVHRVANPVRTHVNVFTWALTFNTELQRVAGNIIADGSDQQKVLHALEWLCVPAAIQLKKIHALSYLLSLYTLENERSAGGALSESIKYLERSGCREAFRVIVNTKARAELLHKIYKVPKEKVTILGMRNHWIERLLKQYSAVLAPGRGEAKPRKAEAP
jgi:hypothetical protein